MNTIKEVEKSERITGEFSTFNELYKKGTRFIESDKFQFVEELGDGFFSGFTLETIKKGKVSFILDGNNVNSELLEKALNYAAYLRLLEEF